MRRRSLTWWPKWWWSMRTQVRNCSKCRRISRPTSISTWTRNGRNKSSSRRSNWHETRSSRSGGNWSSKRDLRLNRPKLTLIYCSRRSSAKTNWRCATTSETKKSKRSKEPIPRIRCTSFRGWFKKERGRTKYSIKNNRSRKMWASIPILWTQR